MENMMSIRNKALELNLDPVIFGTLAEIGAGQEVARHFFSVGGASGTVAKTISAYDKTFSDVIYNNGKTGRYVDEGRLKKMLAKEYEELTSVYSSDEQKHKKYFAFADTVETLNFHKTNSPHGWMGIRFQMKSGGAPNDIILHFNLLENDTFLQQATIGNLGVNLIYAAYHYASRPNKFLQTLMDYIGNDRLEINYVSMSGPELDYVDNRLLGVQLVKNKMTVAVMFDRYGKVRQPSDMLYKKDVLVMRGSFRPVTYVGFDMLKTGYSLLKKEPGFSTPDTVVLCEMSLNSLMNGDDIDERDFLDRVDILNGMGQNVMVSCFFEFYSLARYFSQFKIGKLRLLLGVNTLLKVFDNSYYTRLKGGLLEALALLFSGDTRLYIYPFKENKNSFLLNLGNISLDEQTQLVFEYLKKKDLLVDIHNYRSDTLGIFSWEVLEKIKSGDESWTNDVPKYISERIVEKGLFGYMK